MQSQTTASAEQEARQHARSARLTYVDRSGPGITRHRAGKGFFYRDPSGDRITAPEELTRIKGLAIPPAYRDVWICANPKGHLQAVGKDSRNRLQYRYHPRWRLIRDEDKFARMLVFGDKLPLIRQRVDDDLRHPSLNRARVLAAVVRLMERTMARIGNETYARDNRSFGLTTLRHRHAHIEGGKLALDFRGKHGIEAHLDVRDPKLVRVISRLQDLPGQKLFQYLDDEGEPHEIHSQDVNAYLQEISGEDITAKDFRTWAATHLAALTLSSLEASDSRAKAKKNILRTIEHVASQLGNTPSVCRKCYIHPQILTGYLDGSLREAFARQAETLLEQESARTSLSADEALMVGYLSRLLDEPAIRPSSRKKP
ncbi:DNA topoisomerase IB [Asaia bogorensis]|uniref:DNA topoisomerase IB n=1 Tax=Asaia bogorensis TaxID=91915 RepID=UPI0028565E41|nr:DNA topoisomerase IB [Asaia bogorensis]MDR6181288.1 DNA topoisomerase-1 [Asaia bogorensis NBRC 16594]